jgi:hypothetical protein
MLCLGLWFAAAAVLYAGGQPESRIAEVEKLVQQQDYAAALKLLAAIQRSDPNLRDETARIMAEIMAVTKRYNSALEAMNKAIESGDVVKMQELVPELQKIDPARARGVSGETEVLLGFLKLMNSAGALLSDGRVAEALSLYLLPWTDPGRAGVRLPLAQFESAGYGEMITSSVRRITAAVVASAREQEKTAGAVPAVLAAANSLLSAEKLTSVAAQDAADRFNGITAPLRRAAAAEGETRSGEASLADISRSLQLSSDKGRDDLYLRYLMWLLAGRESRPEGLSYALHLLWADDAQSIAETAAAALGSAFRSARARYESGDLAAADARFQEIPARSTLAAAAIRLLSARFGVSDAAGGKSSPEDSAARGAALGRLLEAQEDADESRAYRLLISYRRDLDGMPPASGESARLAAARKILDGRMEEALSQDAWWSDHARSWESKVAVSETAGSLAESARRVAGYFRAFAGTDLQNRDVAYALAIASNAGASFPKRLSDAVAQRVKAEDLKDGTVNGQVPPGMGIALKHPEQALQILPAAAEMLDSLVGDVTALATALSSEKSYVKASAGYGRLFSGTGGNPGYDAILRTAQSERARIDTLTAAALSQVDNAAVASREGDNSYAQAQAAIDRGDPEGAISSLDLATSAYVRSLADQYTEHAASRRDQGVKDINKGILDLQNRISVANAQRAVTAINKLIATKDFLSASDALEAAVRSWSQNQEGTYQPFENLSATIKAAVELSQGREISPLDAKADVVNAFIRNAQDNLSAGKLGDASRNVNDALAVAPNYGAAKVLLLKIKKQTDPQGFQRDAAAEVKTYMTMGADRGNIEGQKTAYLALLDYSKLDPKFAAQTRGMIQELEYTLGLARRPPTAQQIAQSNDLVQRANAAQQQGSPEAYQSALDLLKQALQVNPENTNAVRLDGLIRTRMGSTALTALSNADTQAYNQALSLFTSGAYQDSYDAVMKIWSDPRSPRNKTYGPLIRLKKRLEVQLNIS